MPTFINISALDYDVIYISAGRRGLEVAINPEDLSQLTRAKFSELV